MFEFREGSEALNLIVQGVRSAIGANDRKFSEMLGLDLDSYHKIQRGIRYYSYQNLSALASETKLSVDELLEDKVDLSALSRCFSSKSTVFPERYGRKNQQLVRTRSIKAMCQYVRLQKGQASLGRALDKLQIPHQHFGSSEEFVSLWCLTDLLNEFCRLGFGEHQLREMGAMTLMVNHSTPFGRIMQSMRSPRQLYEDFHERYTPLTDHVYDYRIIRQSSVDCSVVVTPKESACDGFNTQRPGSRESCLFRQGVYISLLGNIRTRFAHLNEIECMFMGGRRCVYHISWGINDSGSLG